MRLAVLVALVLGLAASASAATAERTARAGVLKGVVTRGPVCSREHPCSALAGVKIVFVRNGHTVARTTTSAVGTYKIRLRAARYGIRLPGHSRWAPAYARVRAGQITRVNIAIGPMATP
jgi:hypothetical protein